MKKGRHRRFEEARSLKRSFGTEARSCPECGAEPEDVHASWCRAEEDDFDRILGEVDAMKLREAALKEGVVINPGPEWSIDKAYSKSRIRLCFASPTHEQIRDGIAKLNETVERMAEAGATLAPRRAPTAR